MSTKFKFSCALSIAFALSLGAFTFRSHPLLQLLLMILFIPMLVNSFGSFLYVLKMRRTLSLIVFIPLFLAASAFILPPWLGTKIQDYYLTSRIPKLSTFIAEVTPTQGPSTTPLWDGGYTAYRDKKGYLIVFFFWGGGFPVKHRILGYLSDDEVLNDPDFRKSWRFRKLQKNWFLLSD
jgi:hypothetical protein